MLPNTNAAHLTERTPLAYSPEGAAALLGMSYSTMRRRIADGTIKSVRVGRRVLVTRETLEHLLRPSAAPRSTSIHHGPRPFA